MQYYTITCLDLKFYQPFVIPAVCSQLRIRKAPLGLEGSISIFSASLRETRPKNQLKNKY